jgi:cobalamin biosynthesis Mg chelatase CobN
MNKDELIKELERLKAEYNQYSNNTSMNEGYRVAIMDAIDLVKKLTI